MEAAIIKIDRSTVKRNPNAGSTQTIIRNPPTVIFTMDLPMDILDIDFNQPNNTKGIPYDEFRIGDNCVVNDLIITNDVVTLELRPINSELVDAVHKGYRRKGVGLAMYSNNVVCEHLPEREWFYEYLPTDLACKFCDSVFDYTKLETREVINEDMDEYIIEDVCPICTEAYCCDYEYEKIEGVLATTR